MHWTVDRFPNQSLLNTTTWRYIYPQLYEVYPNDGMKLNISLTSPPVIKIVENDLDVTIYLDVTVNVLDADEVIPVASVSLVCKIIFSFPFRCNFTNYFSLPFIHSHFGAGN